MPTSVSIDPDLAIGSVIAEADSPPAVATYIADCGIGGKMSWSYFNATASSISGVYNTNVPGVGFKMLYVSSSGTLTSPPFDSNSNATVANPESFPQIGAGRRARIQLIKTGDISSNVLVTLGTVVRSITDGDGATVVTVTGSGTTIKVLPRCTVNASTLNIDFGTFGPREVSTTSGPTQPVNFSLTCSGPTPPASITATLSATPDTTNPNLIANSTTGAQYLGIQLKETSSGTVLIPNNTSSSIVHSPGGTMQDAFALQATVLRTGAATPTVGKIDATATVTLSIL
ncbi:fimbrial protein [Trinickia terrae]|nr:fimbrial protein [Trinickia terrae]